MIIKIWSPDNGDEEDADEKEVGSGLEPEDLRWELAFFAADWLEKNHSDHDYCDYLDVNIRLVDYPHAEIKTLWEFSVEVRMEPTFHAALKKS